MRNRRYSVDILMFGEVEPMNVAEPYEVCSIANQMITPDYFDAFLAAQPDKHVTSQNGFIKSDSLLPQRGMDLQRFLSAL